MSYEDDKRIAVEALAKIDSEKPFGTELFNAISRLSIGVSIEMVAIRRNLLEGKLEVLLTWRDEETPAYKNTWHCPGTFMRPRESQNDTIKRLEQKEFGCQVEVIKKVGWDDNPNEERGHCIHLIFLVKPLGESKGTWFPVDKLPSETVKHHRDVVISMAAKALI
jgi:ADP-ribose pyrophosphatase YjhB (NUDIX family)